MSVKPAVERIVLGDVDSLHKQHLAVTRAFKDVMHEMANLEDHMLGRSSGTLRYLRLLQTQLAILRFMERLAELQILVHGGG
jgi:hypothetical protein